MITRSACIKRAQQKMLQGETDPLYSNIDWSDYFHSAIMRVWRELLDLNQTYFCKRKFEIQHVADGTYSLPSDFHELLWVQEISGEPFYSVSLKQERELGKTGWLINEGFLLIVNIDTYPASLLIDYRRYPKDFPAWDGKDDPEESPYELDYPMNNDRGLVLVSNMIPVMAKVKDGSITDAEFQTFFNQELANFMPRFFADMTNK